MRSLAVGCGTLILLGAAGLALAYVVTLAVATAGADMAVLAGSAALMLAVLGGALVYTGVSGGISAARRRFGRAAPLLWLALFVVVLVAGSIVIELGPMPTALLLPPLHFLAALLPALAIIGGAAWRRGGASWRATLSGLAYGGCGATTIAMIVESVIAVVLAIWLLSGPSGQDLMQRIQASMPAMADAAGTADLKPLVNLILVPGVALAVFALIGLLGPLTEELAKALGTGLRTPPTAGRAWLWGVSIGAGFGLAEALSFGAMGIGVPAWPLNMLVRALATLMHATMAGLGALGVYELVVERRRRRGLAFIGLAWMGHAAWNSGVLLSAIAGILAQPGTGAPAWADTAAALGMFGVIALFATVVLTYRGMSRALEADPATPVEMSPAADGNADGPPATAPEPINAAETVDASATYDIPGLGVDVTRPPPTTPDAANTPTTDV